MPGNGSKWLAGCGLGCGAILLLLVALGTGGYMFVKSRMQSFAEAESTGSDLERRYGKITEYCPEPDGRIAPERIRLFLEVRDKYAPARKELEAAFAGLSEGVHRTRQGQDSIPQVLGLVRQGFGIVPKLGQFQAARRRELLAGGMGPGECVYIYVIVYYSWLGKSPADGPEVRLRSEQGIITDEATDRRDIREERLVELTRQIRRLFIPMLKNQMARLDAGRVEAERGPWRDALDAEIKALEQDRARLPWQDGLPKRIEESLAPFRERLLESYNPMTNPLELELYARGRGESFRGW